MSFLTSILGYPHHPPLDPGTAAAGRLEAQRQPLEQLVTKVKDRLELVPAPDAIYVFVGRPRGTFGLAWLKDGIEHNLKTVIQERRFTSAEVQAIADALRQVYEAHRSAERYQSTCPWSVWARLPECLRVLQPWLPRRVTPGSIGRPFSARPWSLPSPGPQNQNRPRGLVDSSS